MGLLNTQMGDYLETAGTVSDLGYVCQIKPSLVNMNIKTTMDL